MNEAKRGDLVVWEERTSYVTTSQGWHEAMQYRVGVVTSVKRDGSVKAIDGRPLENHFGYQRCWLVSSSLVDVPAAVEAANANEWKPGYPGKPFDSLDGARSVVSLFKYAKAA